MIAILGVAIHLWLYNALITDTFYNAPSQVAAAMVGAPSVVTVIDQIWTDGNLAAEQLLAKGSILSADFAYYLAGFFVYLLVGLTVVYTAFLLAQQRALRRPWRAERGKGVWLAAVEQTAGEVRPGTGARPQWSFTISR